MHLSQLLPSDEHGAGSSDAAACGCQRALWSGDGSRAVDVVLVEFVRKVRMQCDSFARAFVVASLSRALSDARCAQWSAFESEEGDGAPITVAKEQPGMEWIVVDRSNDQLLHIHVRFRSIFMAHTHAK